MAHVTSTQDKPRKRVLFICTHNSCRSQMAEGFGRLLLSKEWDVLSAGLEPGELHPMAVKAMKEVGVDISGQRSKTVTPEMISGVDLVVTLCGDARDRCPVLPPGAAHVHWPVEDPATAQGTEDQVMPAFRKARDAIRRYFFEYFGV